MELTENDNISVKAVLLTFLELKYDCETVYSLTKSLQRDGVTSLEIIPYVSLTANNVLELASDFPIFQNSDFIKIKEVRTKLKIFENKYAKSKKMLLNVDFLQDQFFRNKLRFKFARRLNIHRNLGIYTNAEKEVVGNTQYIYYLLQDDRYLKKNIEDVARAYSVNPKKFELNKWVGKDSCEYIYKCMCIIRAARKTLMKFSKPITVSTFPYRIKYYCADYNTNCRSSFFPKGEDSKATQLYIIHILSNINFLLFVLNNYEDEDYGWWLRINYITYYYSVSKLEDMQAYFTRNNMMTDRMIKFFDRLNFKSNNYRCGKFRNCMMHSKLYDKMGKSMISIEYLDDSKPMFGLVETCFHGMSYYELKESIILEMERISHILSEWLGIQHFKIKPL